MCEEYRTCWICGIGIYKGFLCREHRKRFIYRKEYGIVTLKPRIKISKGQHELFKIVRGVFSEPTFQEVVFDWYKYRRYDIVVPGKRVIFEADGRQHFEFVKFFDHDRKTFRKR